MLILESSRPYVLQTGDIEALAEFWRRALHLSVGRVENDWIELVSDGNRVKIVVRRAMPPRPRARIRLSAFDSRDVAAAVERLVALGATARSRYASLPDHALVTDPHGNTIEITAVGKSQPSVSRPRNDSRPSRRASIRRSARAHH